MSTPIRRGSAALMLMMAPLLRAQSPGGLTLGFEERVRSERWNDAVDHDASRDDFHNQARFRSRLWMDWAPRSDLKIVAGVANENRKVVHPDVAYNGREVFVETLYADWRLAPAWSLKAGRQNLMRGEGFVLFDGSALDGSRSAYFNAVDLAWSPGKSTVEFLAISDPGKDQYLPRLNEPSNPAEAQHLNEWDEQALGLYATLREWEGTSLEAYGFLKTERHDFRPVTNPQFQPDRLVRTVGSRLVRDLGGGWTAMGEAAWQWGFQHALPGDPGGDRPIEAWGGYARIRKAFKAAWKPSCSLGYIGLSGDDPRTRRIEGWDPLFSRWPRWSELYIYSQVPERGVAYATNTGMWEAEARLKPLDRLDLRATWYRMAAFHAPGGAGPLFASGTRRGDLWEVRGDLTLNDHWKGHVVYERLTPGTFYTGTAPGSYLRVEVTYATAVRL
ncbi:MAG TPA: alginate export family protein [Holophagaceae bacterium]